ncbi:MAG: anhydro-N-acetylmuramic acid kinase [Alphaproteobacteria bacterium]|nr:anhydro-N-acetylmuramic acid kinase [Alphaproteobacteria bacterium]
MLTAIGLMSGTSADGIDAALLASDGEGVVEPGPSVTIPYRPELRATLLAAMGSRGELPELTRALTILHAEAVAALLALAGRGTASIDVIGLHGQTVLHYPAARLTRQLGDGALLARLTGIDVVNDFRSADVAAGGQGAPLVPVYQRALATAFAKPLAVLNLGGVGNVTWIGGDGALLAFDTGPGNALLDDWVRRRTGADCDRDGALASAGMIDRAALAQLLAHPYFQRRPPKSLDRNAFGVAELDRLSTADGAATLTAFTAAAVAAARAHFTAPPRRWLVGGGGRRNPALMRAMAAALAAQVDPVEAVGWDGDALEAHAFAYLAIRSVQGLPYSFPGTTGVKAPMTGGRLHKA